MKRYNICLVDAIQHSMTHLQALTVGRMQILANFGGTPFRGDLGAIMADASRRIEQEIAQGIIPSGRQGPRVPEQLVFEYLRHQGYWSTAARVGADLLCDVDSVSAVDMKVGCASLLCAAVRCLHKLSA